MLPCDKVVFRLFYVMKWVMFWHPEAYAPGFKMLFERIWEGQKIQAKNVAGTS